MTTIAFIEEKLIDIAVRASLGEKVDATELVELESRRQSDDTFNKKVHESVLGASGSIAKLSRASEEAAEEVKCHWLEQFHHHDKSGKPTGVFDHAILMDILENENLLIVGGIPYIYSGGVFIPDIKGTKLKAIIRKHILPEFLRAPTEKRIYDLIIGTDSIQCDVYDLNAYPKHWVCFQNGMYDALNRKMLPHSPRYRAINQIPHCYDPNAEHIGEFLPIWLAFIAPAIDDRKMILEFSGLSMTTDTRQQKFLVFLGPAGTGKSTYIRLLEAVIGHDNVSHISLKELTQRFSAFGLMGKLLNSCADLETSALEDTSILKKCLGEDALRVEAKGKDAISIHSYAKLIFSTNEMPLILNEKTNGFYRRLLVFNMNKIPLEVEPDFFKKLEAEIDYFIHLSMEALHDMLERGTITESASSKQAVMELRKDSDTVEAWLSDSCTLEPAARIDRVQMYKSYERYCDEADRTALSKNGFYRALRVKGYCEVTIHGKRVFKGIRVGAVFSKPIMHPEFEDVGSIREIPFEMVQTGSGQGEEIKNKTAPAQPA